MNGVNGLAILGLFLILYAVAVVAPAIKKPKSIWEMRKIQMFIKLLGDRGTVILFYVLGAVAFGLGIWLLVRRACGQAPGLHPYGLAGRRRGPSSRFMMSLPVLPNAPAHREPQAPGTWLCGLYAPLCCRKTRCLRGLNYLAP